MKASASFLVLTLGMAALATVSCKKKGAADGADAEATAAGSAAASSAPAAAPPAPKDLTVDEFVAKIAPTTCKMVDQCKNDKVKATVSMTAMMFASFGSFDKPDLQKQVGDVGKTMKAEKRWLPSEAECGTIGGVALKVLGMSPEVLKDRVGKSVSYDAKKASACITSLGSQPDVCKTEVKLATEPKFKEIDTFSKELHDPLDAYGKPCEGVVEGLVDVGGACDYDLECKGKGNSCTKGKDAKKPKAPPTKSCQPKAKK